MKAYLDPLKCKWCAAHSDKYVPPEIPRNPNLIAVGEAPWIEELKSGKPFSGKSGRLLRTIFRQTGARPILINSRNTLSEQKPTTEQIKMCREAHLQPILDAYPHLPVVSLGQYAATAILGGKRSDSSMAGEVLWIYDRPVVFTYHPAYYYHRKQDERIVQHIKAHIASAIAPPLNLDFEVDKLPKRLKGGIVLDVETARLDSPYYDSELLVLGVQSLVDDSRYLYSHDFLSRTSRAQQLQKVLEGTDLVVGHNVGYDVLHTEHQGISLKGKELFDTLIYEKDKGYDLFGGYGLKFLSKYHFQAPPFEAKTHAIFNANQPLSALPFEDLAKYNAADLHYTAKLYRQDKLYIPAFRQDMDYLRYIIDMMQNGIRINSRALSTLIATYEQNRLASERKAKRLAGLGKDFNFNSWQQVLPMLQQLVGKLPNTQEGTLLTVVDKHPIVPTILDIRSKGKTVSMLKNIQDRVVKATHLVHTTATEHGAETSRTATKEPNIQNWQEKIRHILVSRYRNGKIIYPDLSALEYRLIAHHTGERTLIRDFRKGEDIHANLYFRLFKKKHKNSKERKIAKTSNYAEIYGAGFQKFVYTTGLPRKEAKDIFYNKMKGMYPAIDDFKADLDEQIRSGDAIKVANILGRYRYFKLKNFKDAYAALREAFNWIFQSSGHDIYKLWAMEIIDLIDDPEVLFINDNHDECVFDSPANKSKMVVECIKFVSANLNNLVEEAFGVKLKVPLEADITLDKHWG